MNGVSERLLRFCIDLDFCVAESIVEAIFGRVVEA